MKVAKNFRENTLYIQIYSQNFVGKEFTLNGYFAIAFMNCITFMNCNIIIYSKIVTFVTVARYSGKT